MGLQTREIKEPGFEGTVHTLTCDITQKKLVNILVREHMNDLKVKIKAKSPFAENADSGEHEISGVLYYGPISKEESPRYSTEILDIDFDEIDGESFAVIYVGKYNETNK